MQGNIWRSVLDYARIKWVKALKESKKESSYDGALDKFDMMWRSNQLI